MKTIEARHAMRTVGIGILGFGTVGSGVVDALLRQHQTLVERLGLRLEIKGIADLDVTHDRGLKLDTGLLTTDAESVIRDPEVQVVVELIGGCGVARQLCTQALESGKPVVTANKKLLAEHGEALFDLAARAGSEIAFGASVGGGIPIIRALREGLVGNRIEAVQGILNGTSNYILTRMEREPLSFEEALIEAQRAGYAEADPSLDIDGFDTAHKAAILAALAYGVHPPLDAIPVEGIRGISGLDVQFALEMGYRVKLLAILEKEPEALCIRVQPALVSIDHVLAAVQDTYNAVMVRGDFCGDTLFYGRGAGRNPTASTVVADIADVAMNLVSTHPRRPRSIARTAEPLTMTSPDVWSRRYYLRLPVLDRAGSFARIAGALGAHGVSIASVMQKDEKQDGRFVPVVVLTHDTTAGAIQAALADIAAMDIIDGPPVRMPIQF